MRGSKKILTVKRYGDFSNRIVNIRSVNRKFGYTSHPYTWPSIKKILWYSLLSIHIKCFYYSFWMLGQYTHENCIMASCFNLWLYSMIKYSNINQFHINIYKFIMCENDELGVRVWSKVKAKLSPWYTFFSFKGCLFSTFDTTEWCELCSKDPSFKPKNQFRRLYFWKSGQHMPTKKLFAYSPPPTEKRKEKNKIFDKLFFFSYCKILLNTSYHIFHNVSHLIMTFFSPVFQDFWITVFCKCSLFSFLFYVLV